MYNEMIKRQNRIFTQKQQKTLKKAKVSVIGCGGLGGNITEQLVRCGFENITIIDQDVFDASNLNRQLRSNINTIGKPKVEITNKYLLNINSKANITSYNTKISSENINKILTGSEIIIDAVDNIYTRILVSRYAHKHNIPFIHGAIDETNGQLTTFTQKTPTYEELFKIKTSSMHLTDAYEYCMKMNLSKPQVLGTTAAIIGALQVDETIKHLLNLDKQIIAPEVLICDTFNPTSFEIIKF